MRLPLATFVVALLVAGCASPAGQPAGEDTADQDRPADNVPVAAEAGAASGWVSPIGSVENQVRFDSWHAGMTAVLTWREAGEENPSVPLGSLRLTLRSDTGQTASTVWTPLPTQPESQALSMQGVGPGHIYTILVETAGVGVGGFNLFWCTDGVDAPTHAANPACP